MCNDCINESIQEQIDEQTYGIPNPTFSAWQTLGQYEYEYDENGYTGWYRCVNGRDAAGKWPECNYETGATR